MEELDLRTAMLGDNEIEVQVVGGRLFLAEESYDMDTDFERKSVSMSMRAAFELLSYLYDRRETIYKLAQAEQPTS
jgi:hypothetical protein